VRVRVRVRAAVVVTLCARSLTRWVLSGCASQPEASLSAPSGSLSPSTSTLHHSSLRGCRFARDGDGPVYMGFSLGAACRQQRYLALFTHFPLSLSLLLKSIKVRQFHRFTSRDFTSHLRSASTRLHPTGPPPDASPPLPPRRALYLHAFTAPRLHARDTPRRSASASALHLPLHLRRTPPSIGSRARRHHNRGHALLHAAFDREPSTPPSRSRAHPAAHRLSVRNVVPTLTSNKRQDLSLSGRCQAIKDGVLSWFRPRGRTSSSGMLGALYCSAPGCL
jgi:hypothetical protein